MLKRPFNEDATLLRKGLRHIYMLSPKICEKFIQKIFCWTYPPSTSDKTENIVCYS